MPDNPDRLTVLQQAMAAQRAQDALRQAMAQVAAEIKAEQYLPPAAPAATAPGATAR